jgi:hypothetical protein
MGEIKAKNVNRPPKGKKVENSLKPPPLDNIAQLPTEGKNTLEKRARSKFYTQKIVGGLFYLNSPLNKQYGRAYHCADIIHQSGDKLTSRYCNSRICHVCNRIRTAKMMAGYIEPLKALGDLYFTTLTIKNVKAEQLAEIVEKMLKDISNIIRVLREKRKIDISGIRKIEITYNRETDEYHPHIHILHSENVGEIIIDEWLKRNLTSKRIGQDTRPVTKEGKDEKKYLNELFKYASKFVVKDDKDRNILNVYAPALDTILRSLHQKRTMQSFGEIKKIKVQEDAEIDELVSQIIEGMQLEDKVWEWGGTNEIYDWIDPKGKTLTDYKPPNIEFNYFIGDALPLTKKELRKFKKET